MLPDEHYSEIWGQIRIGYACECEASYQIQSSGGNQVNVGRDWTGNWRRNELDENVTRVVLPQDCSLIVYARTKFDFYHDGGIDPDGWGEEDMVPYSRRKSANDPELRKQGIYRQGFSHLTMPTCPSQSALAV